MSDDGDGVEVLLQSSEERFRYYENCGACKYERRKELRRGFPLREICLVYLIMLCVSLPIVSLFPYVYFMIRDFKIAGREEDIGYYVGFVGASYMVGRALTSTLWGMLSDHYGRKPVIIIGLGVVVIFNIVFGMSVSFWMAISSRFLLGCLNGLYGPLKALTTELLHEEHQALGMSTISTAWGTGLVIGPALGGFLAQPAEKYPYIFSQEGLFGRFPYLLPNFCISILALGAGISSLWLPETLHMHNEIISQSNYVSGEGSMESQSYPSKGTNGTSEDGEESPSKKSLLMNWPFMSTILVYCVFGLHEMAYSEIFSLWAVSPKKFGGLSYSTEEVGEVLSISGFGLLFLHLSLYPILAKLLGPLVLSQICGVLTIPLLTSYNYIAKLPEPFLFVVLNCASLLKNLLYECIFTTLLILQNNVVEQHQRGAANGIATTAMSLFQAAGPSGGGAFFSWALKRPDTAFLPGVQIVFLLLNVNVAIGVLLTFKPFLALPEH